ncbi:MAG: SCP2 sterol-binding domain-containing protein [Gammaproteobacteria bacterium]|jgi:predicted lipid carrier protein YhbT
MMKHNETGGLLALSGRVPGSGLPLFPRPLSLPIALLPQILHGRAAVTALNRIFADALRDGELDFMQGRSLRIAIQDMQLAICVTLSQGRLAAIRATVPDLAISGNLHAFLLMAARRADPDTLFFQRLLHMEGDTELGLALKNFLAAQDMEARWLTRQLEVLLRRALPLYERWF